jgi:thiamine-phosphate pyrophosphorylase
MSTADTPDLRTRLSQARLYLCMPDRPDLPEFIAAVVEAGVDIVQLRERRLDDGQLLQRAIIAREATHRAGALFVLNDRPDIALACGADGVHVGQDDLPPKIVRDLIGDDLILGLSTHAPAELEASMAEPVDYISVGPVEPTPTKPGRPGTGLGYVRLAAEQLPWGARPFFITGGVSPETLPGLLEASARRFVVVRGIAEATDPAGAVRRLRQIIDAE